MFLALLSAAPVRATLLRHSRVNATVAGAPGAATFSAVARQRAASAAGGAALHAAGQTPAPTTTGAPTLAGATSTGAPAWTTTTAAPVWTTTALPGAPTCTDTPGWTDCFGQSCWHYAANPGWCAAYGHQNWNLGHTANTACCACGGGEVAVCNDVGGEAWTDAGGHACPAYEANYGWCAAFGLVNWNLGHTPGTACCGCGGGLKELCHNVPGWMDAAGHSCQAYATNPGWCASFGHQNYNLGHTANTACCVCGGQKCANVAGAWESGTGGVHLASQIGCEVSATVLGKPATGATTSQTIAMFSLTGTIVGNTIYWSNGGVWTKKCSDQPGWTDPSGRGCGDYGTNSWCMAYGRQSWNKGFTAMSACCVCGGGETPTLATSPPPPTTTLAPPALALQARLKATART